MRGPQQVTVTQPHNALRVGRCGGEHAQAIRNSRRAICKQHEARAIMTALALVHMAPARGAQLHTRAAPAAAACTVHNAASRWLHPHCSCSAQRAPPDHTLTANQRCHRGVRPSQLQLVPLAMQLPRKCLLSNTLHNSAGVAPSSGVASGCSLAEQQLVAPRIAVACSPTLRARGGRAWKRGRARRAGPRACGRGRGRVPAGCMRLLMLACRQLCRCAWIGAGPWRGQSTPEVPDLASPRGTSARHAHALHCNAGCGEPPLARCRSAAPGGRWMHTAACTLAASAMLARSLV